MLDLDDGRVGLGDCMTDIITASGLVQMDRKIRLFPLLPREGDRQPAGRAGSRPAGCIPGGSASCTLAQRAWKRQPTGTSSRLSGLPGDPLQHGLGPVQGKLGVTKAPGGVQGRGQDRLGRRHLHQFPAYMMPMRSVNSTMRERGHG